MSDYLVMVPKLDELVALQTAFGLHFDTPDDRTSSGAQLYRHIWKDRSVTFALMNRQTNTYSSLLTTQAILRENPSAVFLVGTALGNPEKLSIGSVVASRAVIDISERRSSLDGESYTQERLESLELSLDAAYYAQDPASRTCLRRMIARMLNNSTTFGPRDQVRAWRDDSRPIAASEVVLSGNEYHQNPERVRTLFNIVPQARAYDMEASGFALAAAAEQKPWLVVRGISDFGSRETTSRYNRARAAVLASAFLADFLGGWMRRIRPFEAVPESMPTIADLRDEAYRLDGSWRGAMAYLDDHGQPVVFEDHALFQQSGSSVQGIVHSQKRWGEFRHERLEYRTTFTIAKHGYAGGTWSDTTAARHYFGVMLGSLSEDSSILEGDWLGTHREGIRSGVFRWYNISREDDVRPDPDIAELIAELVELLQTRPK